MPISSEMMSENFCNYILIKKIVHLIFELFRIFKDFLIFYKLTNIHYLVNLVQIKFLQLHFAIG